MTLDEVMVAIATAIQPFTDRDKPNPAEIPYLVREMKKLFDEQPPIHNAFIAAVQTVVEAARVGYTRDDA